MKIVVDRYRKSTRGAEGRSTSEKTVSKCFDTDGVKPLATGLNNKGVSLYELKRADEALDYFNEALKADISHPEAVYNRAMLLWNKGEITDLDMASLLRAMVGNHPGKWYPLYLLAKAHICRRDDKAASAPLSEALKLAPDEPILLKIGEEIEDNKYDWPRCLRTMVGHTMMVAPVAFSPDGRSALSGSWDGTLRLWDLKTGKCLRSMEGHTSWVCSVAISPDGRFALSGSNDHTPRMWDLKTGQCLRTLEGHTGYGYALVFSPDGRFALLENDYNIQMWELDWEYEFPESPTGNATLNSGNRKRFLDEISKREKRMKVQASNAGKSWTETEENELIVAHVRGVPVEDIAEKHDRTVGAIKSRLVRLGLIEVLENVQIEKQERIADKKLTAKQAYCLNCKKMVYIKNSESIKMKNGVPATKGVCSNCGGKVFLIGK